ncbi:M20/M25/M40 family metallo-hydrolase [Piscinibacter sp. XHJ-5]|uniref:M20/M25/M40 family metallo-hydrolase n=1 Tax=Piscinibacter sp. XHJ-5 TaxID=3037797 RepID=UPI0024528EEA|nr:M20/M25/M40 family metallo-hydrolase [Piscinibacter sp. XHJ-5]
MAQNDSIGLLDRLIGFPSVSLTPNIALIEYVQQRLAQAGIRSTLFREASGTRANLFATTGPDGVPGIVLSGHTDVVPVEGQALATTSLRPMLCIVGEPTMMQIATGHKGKAAFQALCCGREGHSSRAPAYLNAIHVAADFVRGLRAAQDEVAAYGRQDPEFDIPYSTLHIGKIGGGKALNIVPNECVVDFEIRTVAGESADDLLSLGLEHTRKLMAADARDGRARAELPTIQQVTAYPGLEACVEPDVMDAVAASLPRETPKIKVAYGSEGGLFRQHLNAPVLVCGPGSIEQAHKPDEYVEVSQIKRCDEFLERLVVKLACY